MKSQDSICARTHYEFLNKLLHKNMKGYMQCTYPYNDCEIWMIRLNGRESDKGWLNAMADDGATVKEIFVGDQNDRLPQHKILPHGKRLIFDIRKNPGGGRKYVFCGEFAFDESKPSNDHRIWNKISDTYEF